MYFPSTLSTLDLVPGVTTTQKNRYWLITLDENDAPLFGKQLSVQLKKDTCTIVYWISDCLSSLDDVIRLYLCLGCDAHIPFPSANKYTAVTPKCIFKISLLKSLILPTNLTLYYKRLNIFPNFSSSSFSVSVNDGDSSWSSPLCDLTRLPSPVILLFGSHYRFYTDGSLINLGSPEVSVEVAAIYAALSISPADSTISIYTDSQAAIDASIEHFIHVKRLTIYPVKVKGHDGNYWNEFADYLATSAHHSDDAILLPVADYTSTHNFTFCLYNRDDYVIDWELTWFTLNFSPIHDASFRAHHASRYFAFKFKLFLDELPLLEKLKITRPDLYIDLLTCRLCRNRKEDLMHLILCSKRRTIMHQILQTYQNHLFSKLREAGELADTDPTPMLRRLSSLSC
ncbi:hypothetical protein RclHR1_10590010 [Rhizophagus clarus]|uniref:Uncharacterized protein n=1 Tax=Rhizophagus clarus TaxID=94130 RepID=A0A2Z6QT99_9GLOM|nr:hypothetical protein RclHR1_10590010 [Rhizophagus clarus]